MMLTIVMTNAAESATAETEVECRNLGVGPLRAVAARALGWWFERGERP